MADDRARDALDHLQTAALELIAALRAVLDVAEEAVREPQGLVNLVAATAWAAAHPEGPDRSSDGPSDGPSDSPKPGRAGVEHIRIS